MKKEKQSHIITSKQSIMAAVILLCPFLIAIVLRLLNPDYSSLLYNTDIGKKMICTAVGLEVANAVYLFVAIVFFNMMLPADTNRATVRKVVRFSIPAISLAVFLIPALFIVILGPACVQFAEMAKSDALF